MRRIALTFLAAVAVFATATPAAAPASPARTSANQPATAPQWRSFWVDTFHNGIYNPAQVDQLVADAQAANINALIVQVGRWADCYCNRSSFPRAHTAIAPAPYDPLDYVIQKAHAAGIEVHAWVNATPIWNTTAPPPQPDHIFNTHGTTATGADRWLNKKYDGSEVGGPTFRGLDLANPAATDYYVNGMASIARDYDIDGIHLDYIRYPDYNSNPAYSDWGYSDVSLDRFRAATGRADTPLPSDTQFSDWRRAQVTNYVRKIYLTLYGIDRSLRLSHSGITYGHGPQSVGGWEKTRTFAEVNQDWKGWLAEGIMDTTVAMNYKREHLADQQIMYQEWNEVLADWQAGRQNVVGPAAYLNTVENSLIQARKALTATAAGNSLIGWSGYSYAVPSSVANSNGSLADSERARLTAGLTVADPSGAPPLFGMPAQVPPMPWKATPTQGQVVGTLALADGTRLDQVPVTLTHLRTGERVSGRLTDGSGWFGLVDLEPGLWLVHADLPDGMVGKSVDLIVVRPGRIATPNLTPLFRI